MLLRLADNEKIYRTPPQPINPNGIQTRSGRSLGTPMSSASPSSRMSASPRGRKNRKGKERTLRVQLPCPLSEIAEKQGHPVQDMEAWVNRSSEARQVEAAGSKKKTTPRPLNSFMLYRMAYKQTIKAWSEQGDNNQMISSVAGVSWKEYEPKEVKDRFTELSEREKTNHAIAFPGYKFAPKKDTKKRDRDEDSDDGGDWEGSTYSNKRRRRGGRFHRDITRSRSTTPAPMLYNTPFHPSSYQASNPQQIYMYQDWAPPAQIAYHSPPQFEYYQQSQQMYAPTSVPHHDHCESELVGLPPNLEAPFEGHEEAQYGMDPVLSYGSTYNYDAVPQHMRTDDSRVYEHEPEPIFHPGSQTLAPADPMWSPNGAGLRGNAFDAEFESFPQS